MTENEIQSHYYSVTKFVDKLYGLLDIERTCNVNMESLVKKLRGKIIRKYDFKDNEYELYKINDESFQFVVCIPERISSMKEKVMLSKCISELVVINGYLVDNNRWTDIGTDKDLSRKHRVSRLDSLNVDLMKISLLLDRDLFVRELKQTYCDGYYDSDVMSQIFFVPSELIVLKGKLVGMLQWG